MKVIVPCAGKSSRFPNTRPKWMLTHPDGNLMVKKAIDGLGVEPKDLVVTIIKEHDEKYDIARGLKENIGKEISVVILDKHTSSQPETVYLTLKEAGIRESFLIKDSDNWFPLKKIDEKFNYVCYSDLQNYEEINPGNKSYIRMNEQSIITDIVEKKVVSRFFNVGGYFFKDPGMFMSAFEQLGNSAVQELYTSHVIEHMIASNKEIFFGKYVETYSDWGTLEQWFKYRQQFKTYFIDLDGIVFRSAAQYFAPRWENAEPIMENVEAIKKLRSRGTVQIIFVSARSESYRQMTEKKLSELGLAHEGLILGCYHATRILINDFSSTSPYPSCDSINILRDSEDLRKYISV